METDAGRLLIFGIWGADVVGHGANGTGRLWELADNDIEAGIVVLVSMHLLLVDVDDGA